MRVHPSTKRTNQKKTQTIAYVARALLFQAALPLKFWGESILAATHIINRTPSSILGWRTPFHILLGCSPRYNHFKIFGSLCFATNLNPHKTKFHKRAHRDVNFHEGIFPFAQQQASALDNCPLPVIPPRTDNDVLEQLQTPSSANSSSEAAAPLNVPVAEQIDIASKSHPPLRRSSRTIQRPQWLNDFVCQHNSSLLHSSSATYDSFVASLNGIQELRSFAETVKHPQW
ncbi:UNVERIFIED_CONTAM: hypothetical protein Sindi_0981800 [Sesamum indicum]